jgi:hypothetical protein
MRVGGQHHTPGIFNSSKEKMCKFYRRLSGPQGRSGRQGKSRPQAGFEPRTVQGVAIPTELSLPTTLWVELGKF